MDITKIKNDKIMFEKIVLAYWYSIPCDSGAFPDKIEIIKDNDTFFNVNLIRNKKMYGIANIQKSEIDQYLEKLKGYKEHEIDIINRLEKEISEKKDNIVKDNNRRR
jgi:hypothetical protein